MAYPNQTPANTLHIRPIRRNYMRQKLALAASLALLISSCNQTRQSRSAVSNVSTVGQPTIGQLAVSYDNAAQCEAAAQRQQAEYTVLSTAHQTGKLAHQPNPPSLQSEDCTVGTSPGNAIIVNQPAISYNNTAQCKAAVRRQKAEYAILSDAHQTGKLAHQPSTPALQLRDCNHNTTRYRNRHHHTETYRNDTYYNETYYNETHYNETNHTNTSQPRRSQTNTPNQANTSKPKPSQTTRPQTQVAPQRPQNATGQGTIKGRSSQGFGSTYKSTGRGGK